MTNEILHKFIKEIKTSEDDEFLDIANILDNEQKDMYVKLEVICRELFANDRNLFEGLKPVSEGDELTQYEQLFVLMMIKLYEISFVTMTDPDNLEKVMQKMTQTMMPPLDYSPEVA